MGVPATFTRLLGMFTIFAPENRACPVFTPGNSSSLSVGKLPGILLRSSVVQVGGALVLEERIVVERKVRMKLATAKDIKVGRLLPISCFDELLYG